MAHASLDIVTWMMTDRRCGMITKKPEENCMVFVKTKQSKPPETGKPVENSKYVIIRIDIYGPVSVQSVGRNRYFNTSTTTAH